MNGQTEWYFWITFGLDLKKHNLINKGNILFITGITVLSLLLSSCDATRYLHEGDTFSGIDRVLIKSPKIIEDKSYLIIELEGFIKQKRNKNRMNVYAYYANQDPEDTLWHNRFILKFIAEPPSILNEEIVKSTAKEMEDFLRNKRGFYNAKVDYKLIYHERFKETGVDYLVYGGKRYRIRSVNFYAEDSVLNSLMQATKKESLLVPGNPVTSLDYEYERNRLTNLFQNNGYSQFIPNFIELSGDSSNFQVDLKVSIMDFNQEKVHPRYTTGWIKVYTDFNPVKASSPTVTEKSDSIYFVRRFREYLVKPEVLSSKISLREGEIANKSLQQETYNRLSQLSPYKFVMIRPVFDSLEANKINYDLMLVPKPKLWQSDYGLNLNYTSINQDNQQLFGVGGNASIENNNLFGGAERFVSALSANTDIRDLKFLYEFFLTNSNSIYIPKPIGLHKYSGFYPVFRLALPEQYRNFSKYGQTRLSLNAYYHSLSETFDIFTVNASLGYQFKPGEQTTLYIDQFTIDYHTANIIRESLKNEPYIKNSLSPYLLTGFLFDDLAIGIKSKNIYSKFTWSISTGIEFSGLEMFLLNKLYNQLSGTEVYWTLKLNEEIRLAKYFKTHFEYRNNYAFSQGTSLASRFFIGFGVPFGDNSILPYTKQFYAGGVQSIRAWPTRGLGPGSYVFQQQTEDQVAFQKGDIKLEANIEYRFNLPWYFEGAVFIDAGNIWLYNDDTVLKNARFTKDFYKQIAMGPGFGLRLNFNFLIIRFDLGYKWRLPYLNPATNTYWVEPNKLLSSPNPNFGLDYSF